MATGQKTTLNIHLLNLQNDVATEWVRTACVDTPHVLKKISREEMVHAETHYIGGINSMMVTSERMDYFMRKMNIECTADRMVYIARAYGKILEEVGCLGVVKERNEWGNRHKKGEPIFLETKVYEREPPQLRGIKSEPNNEMTDTITGFPFVTHAIIPKDEIESSRNVMFLYSHDSRMHGNKFTGCTNEFFKTCGYVCSLKYFKVIELLKQKDRKLEPIDTQTLFYNIISKMTCHMLLNTVIDIGEYDFMMQVCAVVEYHLTMLRDKFSHVDEMISIVTSDSRTIVIPKMTLAMAGEFFITMFKSQYAETKNRVIQVEEDYYKFVLYLFMALKNTNGPMEKMAFEKLFRTFSVKSIVTCLEMSNKYISNELAYECLLMLLSMFRITFMEKFLLSDSQLGARDAFATAQRMDDVEGVDKRIIEKFRTLARLNNNNKRPFDEPAVTVKYPRSALRAVPEDVPPDPDVIRPVLVNPVVANTSGGTREEKELIIEALQVKVQKELTELEKKKARILEAKHLSDEVIRSNNIRTLALTDFFYCTETLVRYLFEEQSFNEFTKNKMLSMKEWFMNFIENDFDIDFTTREMFSHLDSFILMYYLAHDSVIYHLLNVLTVYDFEDEKITLEQHITGKTERIYARMNCMKMLLDVHCISRITELHDEIFGPRENKCYKASANRISLVREKLHKFIRKMEETCKNRLDLSNVFNSSFAEVTEKMLIRTLLYNTNHKDFYSLMDIV